MWWLLACSPDPVPPGDDAGTAHTAAPSDEDDTATSPPAQPHTAGHTGPLPVAVEPPLGGTSGGDGGDDHPSPVSVTVGATEYRLIAPRGSSAASAVPFLLVVSGTEGVDLMALNVVNLAPLSGLSDAVVAVLDGRTASARDLEAALDDVRADYDVDNDRTWLLSESAGTRVGLEVGLDTRQSTFAAYWANDVNARATPALDADALGFAPWGNAGPGGDLPDAQAIVDGMAAAGYQLPADAPYSGPGSGTHGDTRQFIAAMSFFADKSR